MARQPRYKRQFGAKVRASLDPKVGDSVFLRREKGDGNLHKHSARAYGPFRVVKVSPDGRTVDIRRNNHDERVNVNRVELIPASGSNGNDKRPAEQVHGYLSQSVRNEGGKQDKGKYFVLQDIVDHAQAVPGPPDHWVMQVKWYGFKELTWETLKHVRRSQVIRYCRRKRLSLPGNIEQTMES